MNGTQMTGELPLPLHSAAPSIAGRMLRQFGGYSITELIPTSEMKAFLACRSSDS
jgi:hypothetical protein